MQDFVAPNVLIADEANNLTFNFRQAKFSNIKFLAQKDNCSDFRYESNGIFVLGVGFFSSDKLRLFN